MEKIHSWCGQPSYQERLKNRTEINKDKTHHCCRCKWRTWICRSFYTLTPIAPASAAAPAPIFFHSVGCDWTDPRQIYRLLCMRSDSLWWRQQVWLTRGLSSRTWSLSSPNATHSTPLSNRRSSTRRLLIDYHVHWLARKHDFILTSLSRPTAIISQSLHFENLFFTENTR